MVRPRPPYSSGTDMPSTPSSASFFMFGQGKVPSMYFCAFGLNSASTRSRTVETMLRCCSVSLKSIAAAPPLHVTGTMARSGMQKKKGRRFRPPFVPNTALDRRSGRDGARGVLDLAGRRIDRLRGAGDLVHARVDV